MENIKNPKLMFKKTSLNSYSVINASEQFLGELQRRRVGRFMHWCFVPVPVQRLGDLWFTNGCMKEISAKITTLYSVR